MKKAVKSLLFLATLLTHLAFAQGTMAYGPELLMSRFASWGIDPEKTQASINLFESWKNFKKNKDVVVAVIDTGIQIDHPFLKDNIHVLNGQVSQKNFGVDFSTGRQTLTPFDKHGHGTHVAGIVKSVFPDVKILALKYYNPAASGQANLAATIKALRYAVDNNVDIINYSGGGPESSVEELKILKEAERKGILVVAAAGNERSNIDEKRNAYYPASYGLSNIITVGAYDDMLNIIPSSNYGKKSVDIAAPGHRIRSAIPGSGAAYMTGTSQATAFVTGVAALIKSKHPSMTYDQIKNIVLSSSNKITNFEGKILGAGKLDAGKALALAESVNQKIAPKTQRSVANH
ncbi:MAG TPA: S8 family peptidase [Bacteriovoracaceae bacterium]|nr:S8 family peptidase [Bacteriovoracaceae bacterium]